MYMNCTDDAVGPTNVRLGYSYSDDVTGDDDVIVSHVADDVTAAELPLRRLPLTLRCHVTALSANHVEPRVTVSLDGADVTSRFTRSTTLTSRSEDGGLLTTTDYRGEFAWNVTLKQELLDLHASNWSCSAAMSHYQPIVTSLLIYVTRTSSAVHLHIAVYSFWQLGSALRLSVRSRYSSKMPRRNIALTVPLPHSCPGCLVF